MSHDADEDYGGLMFYKPYWKQRFTYEIKLHGGDMPYIAGQYYFCN